ncbi:hypothetical protein TWF718_009129 [Orbilia javanica]|uniref:Uncharacterized protein n=1 Tax=Orbilia javanica TaxID=47235 RepID=A0AAN8MP17_9PEZI
MHLSSVVISAVGLASIAFAAPNPSGTTATPPDCTFTATRKWTHGLAAVVKEHSTWTTQAMTVDCHGCTAYAVKTVYIKPGGGYTDRASKTKVFPAKAGVVGTKWEYVCRTGTPEAGDDSAAKPAIQAKPAPSRFNWKDKAKPAAPGFNWKDRAKPKEASEKPAETEKDS